MNSIEEDVDKLIDVTIRNCDEKLFRERMKWPAPNYDDELEELVEKYKTIQAQYIFGENKNQITESGLSLADEYIYCYNKLMEAFNQERKG